MNIKNLMAAAAIAMSVGVSAQAASVTINTTSTGAANSIDGLTGFATTGADMVGMLVTAGFNNGSSSSAAWAATGGASGGATGPGWSVNLAGNSFDQPFRVLHSSVDLMLISLFFEGAPGNTVFDIVSAPNLTPGSAEGKPYQDVSSPGGAITVTYSRPLSVAGTFFGDLYVNMFVDYSGLTGDGCVSKVVEILRRRPPSGMICA